MTSKQNLKSKIKEYRKSLKMPPYRNLKSASMRDLIREESMLRYFISLEFGTGLTIAKQLMEDGIEFPAPDSLEKNQVHEKVWEVIDGLAKRGYYLCNTDHLSDRQLYEELWNETLNDDAIDIVPGGGIVGCEIDVAGDGHDFLQYYASESQRECHAEIFPDDLLPPQKPLPYDRDSKLPHPSKKEKVQKN